MKSAKYKNTGPMAARSPCLIVPKSIELLPWVSFFDEDQQMLKVIYCGMDGID